MATAKKRGAPASASVERRDSREKRRQVGAVNRQRRKEAWHEERTALVQSEKAALPADVKPDGRASPFPYTAMTAEQLQWFEEQVVLETPVDDMPGMREDFPTQYQLWKGIADTTSALSKAYARGKEILVARKEELIEKIARTPQLGVTTVRGQRVTKDGDVVDVVEEREGDMLGHRALLIDTHKWSLAHLRPRKHGRNANPDAGKPNEQLKALIESLNAGPVD